jgi:hypothetical protein
MSSEETSPSARPSSPSILAQITQNPELKFCIPSSGPFSHPTREPEPCKICHVEIERKELALTHTVHPCDTSFHADCLLAWLPYAAPADEDAESEEGPSCPNCRNPLGTYEIPMTVCNCGEIHDRPGFVPDGMMRAELDHSEEDRIENAFDDNPTADLPGYAYPVESLGELLEVVGETMYWETPYQQYGIAVDWHQIPVFNPVEDALPETASAGVSQTLQTDVESLFQEIDTYTSMNARQEINRLMSESSGSSESSANSYRSPHTPFPAGAVHAILHTLYATKGVTHYDAYYFPDTEYSSTTFYVPVYPSVHLMNNMADLRDIVAHNSEFVDPGRSGRWLRSPLIHTVAETRDAISNDTRATRPYFLDAIIDFIARTPHIRLEGFAFWLPSDVRSGNANGRAGRVFAVPWVSMDLLDEHPGSDHERASGFLFRGGWHSDDAPEVDFRRYWSQHFDQHLYSQELANATIYDFIGPQVSDPRPDPDALIFHDLLDWEMTTSYPGDLTAIVSDYNSTDTVPLPGMYLDTFEALQRLDEAEAVAEISVASGSLS